MRYVFPCRLSDMWIAVVNTSAVRRCISYPVLVLSSHLYTSVSRIPISENSGNEKEYQSIGLHPNYMTWVGFGNLKATLIFQKDSHLRETKKKVFSQAIMLTQSDESLTKSVTDSKCLNHSNIYFDLKVFPIFTCMFWPDSCRRNKAGYLLEYVQISIVNWEDFSIEMQTNILTTCRSICFI